MDIPDIHTSQHVDLQFVSQLTKVIWTGLFKSYGVQAQRLVLKQEKLHCMGKGKRTPCGRLFLGQRSSTTVIKGEGGKKAGTRNWALL